MRSHDDNGPEPDLLAGYKDAGARLARVLADAEKRLLEAHRDGAPAKARLRDCRVHTQCRQDYARRSDKERIINAATRVLDETYDAGDEESRSRFQEALLVLEREDERVFVCTLLGNVHDLVYWDWEWAYTVNARSRAPGRNVFTADVERRAVASPGLAVRRYGQPVVAAATVRD